MSFDIVPIRRRHLKEVMRIDAAVYPQPWSKRLWTQELQRDHRLYRCALHQGTVVGTIGLLVVADDAHVMTVAVDPAMHRQGVATRLLLHAIGEVVDVGCTALTLEVRVSNTAAQALYRRFGMAPVGNRRNYYEPDGEDALVMWAHEIQSSDYRDRLASIASEKSMAVTAAPARAKSREWRPVPQPASRMRKPRTSIMRRTM